MTNLDSLSWIKTEFDDSILIDIYKNFTPESIVEDYEKVNNLEDFWKFQRSLQTSINNLFKDYIENYSDSVKKTFLKGSLMGFNGSDEDLKEVLNLLYQKNELYYSCLIYYVEKWWLDKILKTSSLETIDVLLLLKSNLIKNFNKIFINWLNIWKKYEENIPSGMYYWWISKDGLKPFSYFVSDDFQKNELLTNKKLKEYIDWIISLSWKTFESEQWEENMKLEPQIWQDKDSSLWFVWPQETYYLTKWKWELVEPHVALYIKEAFTKEKEEATRLYNKYFWENYNVASLQTFLAEPIFEAWSLGFQKIAWESIPNPTKISKEYWKINLVIPSRLSSRMLEWLPYLEKIIWRKLDEIEINEMILESSKFVKFHELGHSLFKNWEYKNELEELKADLSYFLKIFDELENWIEQDINSVFNHVVVDAIRVFQNINPETWEVNESMRQYIYALTIELLQAFATWFMKFEVDKLVYDKNKFRDFVVSLKDILFEIKDNYETSSKNKEKFIFQKYYDFDNENIQKLIKIANE